MSYDRPSESEAFVQEIEIPIQKRMRVENIRPPQIKESELGENKKLVSDEVIRSIEEKLRSGELKVGEDNKAIFTKKELNALLKSENLSISYNLLVSKENNDYQLVAIYKGAKHKKALGEGSFGVVKLGQHLNTGEIIAIKIQRCETASAKETQLAEMNTLKSLGLGMGLVFYPSKNKKSKKPGKRGHPLELSASVMTLAPGQAVTEVIESSSLPADELMLMAVKMTKAVDYLHTLHNTLHLDIKLRNFVYHKNTGTISLIDYGTALKREGDNPEGVTVLKGSPAYMPPELRDGFDNLKTPENIKSSAYTGKLTDGGYPIFTYGNSVDI